MCFVLNGSLPLWLAADGRVTAGGAPVPATATRTSGRALRVRIPAFVPGVSPGAVVSVVARTTWVDRHRCRPTRAHPSPCVDLAPTRARSPCHWRGRRRRAAAHCPPACCWPRRRPVASSRSPSTTAQAHSLQRCCASWNNSASPRRSSCSARTSRSTPICFGACSPIGDAIGDHSWDHANLASAGAVAAGELTRTNAAIEAAAGYHPCLFRAPFRATSPALIATAGALGMLTVGWDVDPRDWSLPGPDAILDRILVATRPGAIVLMHDGGGPREQTVAALPRVITRLRAAGYGFVTVPQLAAIARPTSH